MDRVTVVNVTPEHEYDSSCISQAQVKRFSFSAGETCIELPEIEMQEYGTDAIIMMVCTWTSDADTMAILQATDILRRHNYNNISLHLPYMPYSRQDRYTTDHSSFALMQFANQISSCNFISVSSTDAHSNVSEALFDNFHNITAPELLSHVADTLLLRSSRKCESPPKPYVVSPDAGAYKKIFDTVKECGLSSDVEVLCANKMRDAATGEIVRTTLSETDLQNRTCIVVDDLCDGGYTFIKLAEELKKAGAGDLHLVITHGIFSKGLEVLKEHYKTITCSNTYPHGLLDDTLTILDV